MDLLNMLGNPGSIQDVLSDSSKVKMFLPMLAGIAETYKLPDEHAVSAIISFEKQPDGENRPILRVVATKIEETEPGAKKIVISRNVNGPNGEPLKFDLLSLLIAHNEETNE